MARTICYCRRCKSNTVHSVSEPRQLPRALTLAAPVIQMLKKALFPPLCLSCLDPERREMPQEFPFSSPRPY